MVSPSSPGSAAALPRRWQWLRKAASLATAAVLVLSLGTELSVRRAQYALTQQSGQGV